MSHPLYSDAYDGLPITAPIGCPHLIKPGPHLEDERVIKNLRMADGVVTLLYHYHPDLLTKFLDKNISECDFVRCDSVNGNLSIVRDGNDVICGTYVWNEKHKYWKTELAFQVDEITGIWKPWYVNGACVHFTFLSGSMAVGPSEYFGAKLAQSIMLGEEWRSGLGVEFMVRTKSA